MPPTVVGVRGAVVAEDEATAGNQDGTDATRVQSLTCSRWPRGHSPLRRVLAAGPGATVGPVDTGVPRSVRWRQTLAPD